MVKTIVKKEIKKVSVNFKQNVLLFLAETIANSSKLADGLKIDDITSLPVEVKIVKTSREPVLVCEISGITVKIAISVPKNEVEGELLAVATLNEEETDSEEVEETESEESEETDGEE